MVILVDDENSIILFSKRANVVVHLDDLQTVNISLLQSLQNVNLKVALHINFEVIRLTLALTSLTVTSSSAHKEIP